MSRNNSLPVRAIHKMLQIVHPVVSERFFLKSLYRLRTGESLNLKNPLLFNEKLQYLKLQRRVSNAVLYVDKIQAKKTAAELIGESYIIPLIEVWKNASDIDFNSLPRPCVIKPSHYGGGSGILFLPTEEVPDVDKVVKMLNATLRENVYRRFGEYPYESVHPAIFAEKMLIPENGELRDYKFFCFDGIPKLLKVDSGRFSTHHADYFTTDWQPLDIMEMEMPPSGKIAEPPESLSEMLDIATKLSSGLPFVRIDLYDCDGKVYFGEYTFFPASGLGDIRPRDGQLYLGNLMNL